MKAETSAYNDEAYLVTCCKNNEPAAQKALYHRHVERMMIVCLRYIPNREDAKEVLMDAFLKFFNNIDSFSYLGAGSVQAWLKRITLNQCLMHLRKRNDVFVTGKEPEAYDSIEYSDDVLDALAVKDILKLVQALPDGYRMVFNLHAFEGMSHKDIADALNISEGTSKSQLHRARAMLQEKITGADKKVKL